MSKSIKVDDMLNIYDIRIMLQCSFKCNHMCWFCDEWDNKLGRSWTLQDCDAVVNKLKQLPEAYKNVYILFYGGEPTLCKHWEYLHFEIFKIFKNRNVLIQTQSNLSLSITRLKSFADRISKEKPENHHFDICGSYHLGKQHPDEFLEKIKIVSDVVWYGIISYSGEIIKKTDQTLTEFNYIKNSYNGEVYFRTLAVPERVRLNDSQYKIIIERNPRYKNVKDAIDFCYLYDNYPEYAQKYLPFGVSAPRERQDVTRWDNLYLSLTYKSMSATINKFNHPDCDVIAFLEKTYVNAIEQYIFKGEITGGSPKYMRCDSFNKGLIITHDLITHSCLDNYYNNIKPIPLHELDFNRYINTCHICMLPCCVSSDTHLRTSTLFSKNA